MAECVASDILSSIYGDNQAIPNDVKNYMEAIVDIGASRAETKIVLETVGFNETYMTRANNVLGIEANSFFESRGLTAPSATPEIEAKTTAEVYDNLTFDPAQDVIGHSGGAKGADTTFGDIIESHGGSMLHYWLDPKSATDKVPMKDGKIKGLTAKPPGANTDIGWDDKEGYEGIYTEGKAKATAAAKALFGNEQFPISNNLIVRNWAQIKHSDAVFAVSKLVRKGTQYKPGNKKDNRVYQKDAVFGGTGYAVEMAIAEYKPVYVFNQDSRNNFEIGWYRYNYDTGEFENIGSAPKLTNNPALIGTSSTLSPEGKGAMEDVARKSFLSGDSTSNKEFSEILNEVNSAPKVLDDHIVLTSSTKTKGTYMGRITKLVNVPGYISESQIELSFINNFSNPFVANENTTLSEYGPDKHIDDISLVESAEMFYEWLMTGTVPDKYKDISGEQDIHDLDTRRKFMLENMKKILEADGVDKKFKIKPEDKENLLILYAVHKKIQKQSANLNNNSSSSALDDLMNATSELQTRGDEVENRVIPESNLNDDSFYTSGSVKFSTNKLSKQIYSVKTTYYDFKTKTNKKLAKPKTITAEDAKKSVAKLVEEASKPENQDKTYYVLATKKVGKKDVKMYSKDMSIYLPLAKLTNVKLPSEWKDSLYTEQKKKAKETIGELPVDVKFAKEKTGDATTLNLSDFVKEDGKSIDEKGIGKAFPEQGTIDNFFITIDPSHIGSNPTVSKQVKSALLQVAEQALYNSSLILSEDFKEHFEGKYTETQENKQAKVDAKKAEEKAKKDSAPIHINKARVITAKKHGTGSAKHGLITHLMYIGKGKKGMKRTYQDKAITDYILEEYSKKGDLYNWINDPSVEQKAFHLDYTSGTADSKAIKRKIQEVFTAIRGNEAIFKRREAYVKGKYGKKGKNEIFTDWSVGDPIQKIKVENKENEQHFLDTVNSKENLEHVADKEFDSAKSYNEVRGAGSHSLYVPVGPYRADNETLYDDRGITKNHNFTNPFSKINKGKMFEENTETLLELVEYMTWLEKDEVPSNYKGDRTKLEEKRKWIIDNIENEDSEFMKAYYDNKILYSQKNLANSHVGTLMQFVKQTIVKTETTESSPETVTDNGQTVIINEETKNDTEKTAEEQC